MNFDFLDKIKRKSTLPGLCSLYLLPNKLVICHALNDNRQLPCITFVETCICQMSTLKLVLTSIVKKQGLQNVKCTWILHPDYYQLFILDRPQIPDSEMEAALRWQVKDLISYPAEDAVVNYFTLPSSHAAKEKIFAAAARKSQLQAVSDVIREVGFNLESIDIVELALRNLINTENDDACYLGLLVVGAENAEFIITHQKNLLLSLRITLGDNEQEIFSQMAKNILQAYTYCQNQQQTELPKELRVLCGIENGMAELQALLVGVQVEPYRLEKKCDMEVLLQSGEQWLSEDLIAIGGALRQE